jgi:hypothetical protein
VPRFARPTEVMDMKKAVVGLFTLKWLRRHRRAR